MQTYICFYLPLQKNNNLKSNFELHVPLIAYTFVLSFAKFFEFFNKLKICYLKIYNITLDLIHKKKIFFFGF